MVAVVGSPAESQLRQVAGTHDDGVLLIGNVHQYLGTLAGLGIFVGGIVDHRIVADVLEVLGDGLGYAYLANGHSQLLHQLQGVLMRAVGCAEAGHGDADDTPPVKAQLVESLDRDKQGKGGVETSADADDGL